MPVWNVSGNRVSDLVDMVLLIQSATLDHKKVTEGIRVILSAARRTCCQKRFQ
jgi:hypothetical protein